MTAVDRVDDTPMRPVVSLPTVLNTGHSPLTPTPASIPDVAMSMGRRVTLGGARVDLMSFDEAVDLISHRAGVSGAHPLGVASINLDHIHYFGDGAALAGDFGMRTGSVASVDWLNLVDGAPIATQARKLTEHDWPRLAGSDLIEALLDRAELNGTSIGFLGGSPSTHAALRQRLESERPNLIIGGFWAPSRGEVADAARSGEIAEEIAAAHVDVLVVCMGKPRQELWIDHYGELTQAKVLLAFGAVVDFLAGRVSRAPRWAAANGLEWAWRLALEPKRLARRYLVDGPPAYRALRRASSPAADAT